jgi:hypothetical protein
MCFPLRSISKRDCIALAKELRREQKPEREDIVMYDTKNRSQCTFIGKYIGVQSEYIYVHLKVYIGMKIGFFCLFWFVHPG